MKNNIHHHYLKSPVEVVTTSLESPSNHIQEYIAEAYRIGDSMNNTTNVKAWMSSYKVWEQTKIFNRLFEIIENLVNLLECFNDPNMHYKITNAWSAVYKKGHYTIPHHHIPSNLSFVYYLKTSGNTPLIFDQCNFPISPKDDEIIIFPSYLIHSVPEHQYEEDRICIAGNLDLFPNK